MKKKRYHLLDGLRGITLLGMIAYHGMFDLVELYGIPIRWFFRTPGYVWQQSVCWTFILLSGFCWRLFGILTFIGTAMLALIPASGILRQIPAWAGLTGSGFLFFLTRNINRGYWGFGPVILGSVPEGFYRGWVMTFLGFPKAGFFSGDYFSFFPWIFLYVCGYFLYDIVMRREAVKKLLDCRMGVFEWIGRHSLVIYMLHQPVLMLILECVF